MGYASNKVIFWGAFSLVLLLGWSQTPTQTANAYYDAGLDKMKQGWLKEAIANFSKCVEISSYYYEAYAQRGKCYFDLGKKQEALADFNTALQKKKDYYLAFYYRALYYRDAGKNDLAYADIQRSMEIMPRFKDAYKTRISWFMEDKKFDEALKDIQALQNLDEDNLEWEVLKGKIWFLQGKDDEAFTKFTELLKKDPGNAEIYYLRGLMYSRKKEKKPIDDEKAYEDFSQAKKLGFKEKNLLERHYLLAMELGHFSEALSDANDLLSLEKKNSVYWFWRAKAWAGMNQCDSAIASVNKALVLQPAFEDAYLLRADCKIKKGKENQAISDFNKVLQLNPQNARAYEERGVYYFNKNLYDKAFEDFNNAIKFGESGRAYFYRGAIKDMQKDTKNACLDLKKAVDLKYPEAEKAYKRACGMIK
jgi:tetratricopeptide (TPR) repeat protein